MSQKLCEHCQKSIPIDSQFCAFCGNRQTTQSLTGQLPANYMLDNRYIIETLLGQGGMGAVYRAIDTRINGRICAIKEMSVMALPVEEQAMAVQNFRREAEFLAKLKHPNLPQVHDYFNVSSGRHYLVMDYVEGSTLEEQLFQNGQPFTENQVRPWAVQLCNVLDYLHKQNPPIIFRDLKPDNIMLDNRGTLKLIDFGIARFFQKAKTKDTQAMGTPGYVPPEQYGKEQTDARSDYYALGVTLWRLLTFQDPTDDPYNLPGVCTYNPTVSKDLESIIQRAMQLSAKDRYQTAEEFKNDLEGQKTAVPPPTSAPTPTATTSSSSPIKPRTIFAIIGILIALCIGSFALIIFWPDPTPTPTPPPAQTIVVVTEVTAVLPTDTPIDETDTPEPTATPTETTDPVPPPPDDTNTPTPIPPTDTPTPPPTNTPTATPIPIRPIVFDSTRNEPQAEIYIMNPDGSNPRRLTNNTVQDEEADMSPDGELIAFVRGNNGSENIWVMTADGSAEQSLFRGKSPDWSPDGRYLSYESLGDFPHIYIYDTENGDTRQLSSGSRPFRAPDWSPDGEEITAMSRYGQDWQIVTIDVNNGAVNQVTSGSIDKRFPAWSPDGSLIAYNTLNSTGWPDDIWVIEPSGSGARTITSSGNNGRPTWSPDGENLVFNSYIDSRWVLYQTDLDGRNGTMLTTQGSDQRASWSN